MADYDILSDAFFADPYPVLSAMRRESPCYYDSRLEAHVITRYHDVDRVLTDSGTFSSRRVKQWGKGAPEHLEQRLDICTRELETWVPFTDPPVHTPLRARLAEAAGPHLLPRARATAGSVMAELLSGLQSYSDIDAVRDFATPAATWVLGELLGISREDMEKVKLWTTEVFTLQGAGIATEEAVEAGYRACTGFRKYATDLLESRKRERGDDVLSALVAAPKEPIGAVSDHDIVGLAIVLFAAGHESTTNLIGNALYAVLMDPAARDYVLKQDGITEDDVDELARYESPFLSVFRKSLKEVAISGNRIGEGEFVLCMINSANRDPRVFKPADKLDFNRPKPVHLGFGGGLHVCPGAHIARIVVREAVTQFLRRFPGSTTEPSACVWHRNLSMRGLSRFPVRLAP